MSTTQTLREPKAKRRRGKPVPQNVVESDKPETALDRYRRWRYEADERQKREGPFEEPLTEEEIVAICKEARAERYAREQEQKNAACR